MEDSVDGTGTLVFELHEYTSQDYSTKVTAYPREFNFNDPIFLEVRELSK